MWPKHSKISYEELAMEPISCEMANVGVVCGERCSTRAVKENM